MLQSSVEHTLALQSTIFQHLSPVAFTFFGLPIKWYGLSYVFSILLGFWLFKQRCAHIIPKNNIKIAKSFIEDVLFFIALGIIIGGRLGYMLFYDFFLFMGDLSQLFMVHKGGMSFHGGLIGVGLALWWISHKYKIEIFKISDILVTIIPIGLFFGRIANFVNQELVGRPTTAAWGIIFPSYDNILRHPSQLYEATFEGIVLFMIMNFLWWLKGINQDKIFALRDGALTAYFMILYGVIRFVVEFFREPDKGLGEVLYFMTLGQVLSLLMVATGAMIMIVWQKNI